MSITKKSLIINKISYIPATGNFLVNEGTKTQKWLNRQFVLNIFSALGLSTQTTFQKLLGVQMTYREMTITQAELDAAGGVVTVKSELGSDRNIEFKKIGLKQFDEVVTEYGASLRASIDNSALTFDNSWAGTTTPAAPVAPRVNTPEPAQVHEEVLIEEAVDNTDAEMGADSAE